MKKIVSFILLSLLLFPFHSTSLAQSSQQAWTPIDVVSPSVNSYQIIKEYGETLVMRHKAKTYFSSINGGLTWEKLVLPTMSLPLGAAHPNTYSVMLKDNGFAVGIRNASYVNSNYITQGYGSMSFFNPTNLNFDIFDTFFEYHTPEGCYYGYGYFDYVQGNFVKRSRSQCSTSEFPTTVCLKNTFAGNNSKTECRNYSFYTPDSLFYEKSMILSESTNTEITYSFADSLNNQFYDLENALGADYSNEMLYYIDEDFFIEKDPATNFTDSISLSFENAIGFAVYGDSIFIADSSAIYTAPLENVNDLTEFINFQTAGYTLLNVDFYETGIFANTEEAQILRIDRSNATFSNSLTYPNYQPYRDVFTNGKDLFIEGKKLQTDGSLTYVDNYGKTIENPYYYGKNEWDSLICVKNPDSYNYFLIKKLVDAQYDTLLSLSDYPYFSSNEENLYIVVRDTVHISEKEAKFLEYESIDLGLSPQTQFAADNAGNLFTGGYSGIRKSNNNGESWETIYNGTFYNRARVFGYNGEVWMHTNNGYFQKWNSDMDNFEFSMGVDAVHRDYYVLADDRKGNFLIQYAGAGEIYGLNVANDTLIDIQVPFSFYKHAISGSGYPYGNIEHGASSFAILNDTIYALSEAGLMKAPTCEIIYDISQDERYFCEGDSIEVSGSFYTTEGEIIHFEDNAELGCRTLFTSHLIQIDSIETDYFYLEAGEEFNGTPLFETTTFIGQAYIDLASMCPVTQQQVVYVNSGDIFYGFSNNNNSNLATLQAYPNPAYDVLSLNLPSNQSTIPTVLVTDCNGKEYHLTVNMTATKVKLDVSSLNAGMYFLTVNTGDKNSILRFVKI